MMIRSALPSIFSAAIFSGAAVSVGSVGIEDEDGAVFAGDLDRLAGVGALVEEVETRLRIVVRNPLADGLPRRLDGFEGFDVEGRVRRWRDDGRFRCGLFFAGGFREAQRSDEAAEDGRGAGERKAAPLVSDF